MNCEWVKNNGTLYVYDELPDDARYELEQHIARCESCAKEVAELRGSLQPFARGAVVTTSHFSKAAINEANEEGKNPIALIDGLRLSKVVLDEEFQLSL